jgi:hypothetical protein
MEVAKNQQLSCDKVELITDSFIAKYTRFYKTIFDFEYRI